tara:strand:+ start:1654 stop:2856 length:1203 start_codon:yes stop_codon:yes gene_type:complete
MNLLKNHFTRSLKRFFAVKISGVVFLSRKIIRINYVDTKLLWILLRLNRIDKAIKIISDHDNEVEFMRLKEEISRRKVFGDDFEDRRLDFNKKDFQSVISINQELINQFPDDYLLYDRMARNYIAGGYRHKAKFFLSKSISIQRAQKIKNCETGLIVFITMPRSGTGYVGNSLMSGLGLKNLNSEIPYIDSWFPDYGIIPFPDYLSYPNFTPMKNGYLHAHSPAIEPNLWSLSLITDRIIVNFRDPRQALLSWVYYMEYLRFTGNLSALIDYKIPDGYFEWTIDKQIDWQINEYFMPINVKWINGWIEADKNPEFSCKIYFSLFENLVNNPRKYFQEILSFYGISENKFVYPEKPTFKGKTHIRKGRTDEWRVALSKKQIEAINKIIPEEWFDKFNWERN